MYLKRITAFILSFLILFNLQEPLLAKSESYDEGTELHKISWKMESEYTLQALTSAQTSLTEKAGVYTNVEGPVHTEIQPVYHADQALVSIGIGRTSLSFAPIMHKDYYLESNTDENKPDDNHDNSADEENENDEQKDENQIPRDEDEEEQIADESEEDIDVEETEGDELIEVSELEIGVEPEEQEDISQEEADKPDEQEKVSSEECDITDQQDKEGFDKAEGLEKTDELSQDDTDVLRNESLQQEAKAEVSGISTEKPDDEVEKNADQNGDKSEKLEDLHTGYGKTISKADLFDCAGSNKFSGTLSSHTLVYILSLSSGQWVQIVFDTPEGIIEGYIRSKYLANLTKEEEQQAIMEAKAKANCRERQGHPLPRTNNYKPTVYVTEKHSETESPIVKDTPKPTQKENQAETKTPENEKTSKPTTTPTEKPENTSSPIPEDTNIPELELDPTESILPMDTPAEGPEEQEQSIGETLLKLFISSAMAEKNQPEETRIRPTSIIGQKIGGGAAKGKNLRSTATTLSNFGAALYAGLFDEATDVRLSAMTAGVKEDIIISRYTGNHNYSYKLKTEGLTASLVGKTVKLYDEEGNFLACIEAPDMTDAAGNHSTDIRVTMKGSGDNYTLMYTPDDNWMKSAIYPVTIDPPVRYYNNLATGIGDVYVSSKHENQRYDYKAKELLAGKKNDEKFIAYIIPSLRGFEQPGFDSVGFQTGTPLLLKSALWNINILEIEGNGIFDISLITSSWDTDEVTYKTKPKCSSTIVTKTKRLAKGNNTINLKEIFSAWFNAREQKENYGFAITSDTSWMKISSSDADRAVRMSFEAEYYTGVTAPKLKATGYAKGEGYGVNSGKGWVELKWDAIDGAEKYLLGFYNGKEYEYYDIGNVTSYSTKGKKLWATQTEIEAKKYKIHWDNSGQELTTIPRSKMGDLDYFFSITPMNSCGQVADKKTTATINVILPDRLPPDRPQSVAVSPAGYTNASSVKVTWSGVSDLPLRPDVMEKGKIQYVLDPDPNKKAEEWAWQSTGSGKANGSYNVKTTGLTDGEHLIYIRGIDQYGNYGSHKYAIIKIDKTAPTPPSVLFEPDSWTAQETGGLSWTGINDINPFRVEYQVDQDEYSDTQTDSGEVTGYKIDIGSLTDGMHTVSVRGVDSVGNIGAEGQATICIDRTAPAVDSILTDPADWTNKDSIWLIWTGAKDLLSGLFSIAWGVDQDSYHDLDVSETGETGIDVSSLKEGEHSAWLKLTDTAGNAGIYQTWILLDRSEPEIGELKTEPVSWTDQNALKLIWKDVTDCGSGLQQITYVLDQGERKTVAAIQNGSATVDISSLTDGIHSLTLFAKDQLGYEAQKEINVYIDRTPPIVEYWSFTPNTCSFETQGILQWQEVTDQTSGLQSISYQFDENDPILVSPTENGRVPLDLSALQEGNHSLIFRVTDQAGITTENTGNLLIDRTPPVVKKTTLAPDNWADTNIVNIQWEGAVDDLSGLYSIEYSLDGGTSYIDLETKENGESDIDVSVFPDGEHELLLRFTDKAQNHTVIPITCRIDRTAPVVEILDPIEDAIVSGILDIQGNITDISLTDWLFTAQDESGNKVQFSGDEVVIADRLGLLDTSIFPDGEVITMELTAHDIANHETISKGVCIKAVHQAQNISPGVKIISPVNNEVLSEVWKKGKYQPEYSGEEVEGIVILDRNEIRKTENLRFSLYPILYPEDSTHTVSVISTDVDGQSHYSQGYQGTLAFSELLQSDRQVIESSNVRFAENGALALTDNASFTLKSVDLACTVMGVRLHILSDKASYISCEYSTDMGSTWLSLSQDKDTVFTSTKQKIYLRCTMKRAGILLQGIDLTGIYESNPVRFKSTLLRPVKSYTLKLPVRSTTADVTIESDCTESLSSKILYIDGMRQSDSKTIHLLPFADETKHKVMQAGIGDNGVLYGSGAKTSVIIRSTPDATDIYETGKIVLQKDIIALRAEALCMDQDGVPVAQGIFEYSTNGTDWHSFSLSKYAFLPETARTIYFRTALPQGIVLKGFHAEGVSLTESYIVPALVKSVSNALVKDYGLYPENQKRYVLSWTDPNITDTTQSNSVFYDIYRNDKLIASVSTCAYTDPEYLEGVSYKIVVRKEYKDPKDGRENLLTRTSKAVNAVVTKVQAPVTVTTKPVTYMDDPTEPPATPIPTPRATLAPVIETARPTELSGYNAVLTTPVPVESVEGIESEDSNSIYANMVYGKASEIPPSGFELDQSLLGPRRFCSIGFEPINFNTGNFFMEARDFLIRDLAGISLDMVRTYNSQSLDGGTCFGEKWSGEMLQTVRKDERGIICWRRADGSLVRFMRRDDGKYITDTTEYEAVEETEEGYRILLTDGTGYIFSNEGQLSRIEYNHGQQILQFVWNERNLLEKIVLPSGRELPVEMNSRGQIVKIQLSDSSCVYYSYTDNLLTEVTDLSGNKTRYEYDREGRMTAWYDGNGVCQAVNTYDDQGRVVAQTDANGGEYHLEYGENYTIAMDPEGHSITYYRDEQQRTSRIVDAQGGETSFTYDEQGDIISSCDPLGNLTMYCYNRLGDKLSETDPRGASVLFTWDGGHHLLSKTDQNGNRTEYTYDRDGNLTAEIAPDGGVTSYVRDSEGQIVSVTDALGNVTSYTYNEKGLLETETDPRGYRTAYTYDENGYLASQTNALDETTLTQYDAKGNLLQITYADGTMVSYAYDALDRRVSMTDTQGNTTRYQYNGLGQLISTMLPDGSKQEVTYTGNGQTSAVTDALGNTVNYTYDENGNCLTVIDADGYVTANTYDAVGNLLTQTNALGGKTVYTYDPTGLPLTVTDPAGVTRTFEYDLCGNILAEVQSNGAKITAEYDSMNRAIRQTNAMGGETRISYDLLGRIAEKVDLLGAKTVYTYDANGNLLTVTDSFGNIFSYTYDALNRVKEEKAPNGAVTMYEYDVTGNLIASTDALGHKTSYEYDSQGNLTANKDALGQVTTLKYDKVGQAVSARQKNGGVLATAYDKAGRVISEKDANGNATQYNYNKRGLITEIIDALNQKATLEYDAFGNISRITAPDGGVVCYEYDDACRLKKTVDSAGCETVYTFNAAGLIASKTVNGNAETYEYDAAGNISVVTDAEGRTVHFRYDLAGNVTEVIYSDGSKDTTEYDMLGRVIRQVPCRGTSTEYAYDELGNTIYVKQGDRITRYEYDLLSRLTKTIFPDGFETSYEYDAMGNLITSIDQLGNRTAYAYTPESLLEKVAYSNGAQRLISYDLAGNVLSETDAEGYTKKYQYDKVNRLTTVTDELGHRTAYNYDAAGNVTQVKDALGHITQYAYDTRGKLTEETDALGNTIRYTYTSEGWMDRIIKADGKEITFTYDKTGNLVIQKAGDEYTVSTGYNELGQITRLSSEKGDIVYQYNEQGYLASVTNGKGETVKYTYDVYGNKETMTLPDGRVIQYTYDAINRMTGVKGFDGEETRYSYDAIGRRIKTESSTLTTSYEFDCVGNLMSQLTEGDSNVCFNYSHNKNGYITKEIRTEKGENIESNYTYDALGQLIAFAQSTGYGERYTYDAAGNMIQKVITPENKKGTVTLKMKYNEGNQLIEMLNGRDRISYSYDLNGSIVQKTLNSQKYGILMDSYTYDVMDHLTGYTGYDGYTQAFTYDADGMRLKKQEDGNSNRSTLEELLRGNIEGLPEIVEPGSVEEDYEWATIEYLYDITEEYYQVLQETTIKESEKSTVSYIYGLERIAGYTANTKTAYIYDGRGSVAQTVMIPIAGITINPQNDPVQGKNIQSYKYTPFGEQQHTKTRGFTYNAEGYDTATGMLNLRVRLYEPMVDRFCQMDLIKGNITSPQSFNRYIYCANSPVEYVDPSGMKYGGPNDKGYYHRLVQDDFVVQMIQNDVTQKDPQIIATEVEVTKADGTKGRIDLLNVNTGEAYEVKPIGTTEKLKNKYTKQANDQLMSYINGKLPGPSIIRHEIENTELKPGQAKMEGEIYDKVTNSTIVYGCKGDGIIRYGVAKGRLPDKKPAPSSVWAAEPEKKTNTVNNTISVPTPQGSPIPTYAKIIVGFVVSAFMLSLGIPNAAPGV